MGIVESVASHILDRFVRSFTSNLGWRVGKSLVVEVEDLNVTIVQDDVEIGFYNESLKIFELDGLNSDNNINSSSSGNDQTSVSGSGAGGGVESDNENDNTT